MKLSLIFAAILFATFCQGQDSTAKRIKIEQQKKKDFAAAMKARGENPAVYQNNIAPIFLVDKTCIMRGHATVLRLENEGYGDSVRRNYHVTLPGEESNVVPLASFVVGGEKIKVQFRLNDFLFLGLKNETKQEMHIATPVELEKMDKEILEQNKSNKPRIDTLLNHYLVRISINNQAIFEWRTLKSFSSNLYNISGGFKVKEEKEEISFNFYGDVYDFLDTALAINDQLFIEIKDDRNGWMIDSYNITRKEMTPKVSLVLSNNKENILAEKKTSF